jgi:hypothetical protein
MAFLGPQPVSLKIITDNDIIEQVSNFYFLECRVSFTAEEDKVSNFKHM